MGDEPPAAEVAEWAGPWRVEETPDGGLELYRLGESAERGYRPFARFQHRWEALLVLAMIASRQEAAYRLQSRPDGRGFLQSLDVGLMRMHNVCMRAVWDPDKAKANLEKHGVRFSDAELVLNDSNAVAVEDSAAQGEQRHVSIGLDAVGRVLVVVYTYRGENVRLSPSCDAQGKAAI